MTEESNVWLCDDRSARARKRHGRRWRCRVGLSHLSLTTPPTSGSPPQASRNEREVGSTDGNDNQIVAGAITASAPCIGVHVADSGLRVVVTPASPPRERVLHSIACISNSTESRQRQPLFCFIDTETTGLNTALDRIVEIAALFDDKQLARLELQGIELPRHFQTLVRPDMYIPARATKVHGIKDSDVANSKSFGRARFELCQWLDSWHKATGRDMILVAHNATYDRDILMNETRRHCQQWADLHRRARWSCSLSAFRRRVRWRNAGLPALVKEYLPPDYKHSAHRALGDCQALLDVLHAMPEHASIWRELELSQCGEARS